MGAAGGKGGACIREPYSKEAGRDPARPFLMDRRQGLGEEFARLGENRPDGQFGFLLEDVRWAM